MKNESFKLKDTRDSNNNSNESQGTANFLRDSFRRIQQKQEASSSQHCEASDHSPADFFLSQQRVRLKNGSEVLAGDIPSIIKSMKSLEKIRCLASSGELMLNKHLISSKSIKLAITEFKRKCNDPNAKGYTDLSRIILKRVGLINQDTEQPNDSVRNIVLSLNKNSSLYGKKDIPSKIVEHVKLRNDTEEDHNLVKNTMQDLRKLKNRNHEALFELHKLCKDPKYTLKDDTTVKVLKSKKLIDKHTRQPSDTVRNIVLSSFDENSGELRSPAMPFDELKTKVRNSTRDRLLLLKKFERKFPDKAHVDVDKSPVGEEIKSIVEKIKEDFQNGLKLLEYIYPHQSVDY